MPLKEATIKAASRRAGGILNSAIATFQEAPLPVRLITYSVVGGGTIAILSGCGAQSQPCEILPTETPDQKGGSCPVTIFSYNPKQIVSLEDQASLKKNYGSDIKTLYQWMAVNKGSGTENKGDGTVAFSTYTFENGRSMVVFPSGKEDYNSGETEAHEYTTSWFETADGKILYSYNYQDKLNPEKAISFFSIEYEKPDGVTLEEIAANSSKLLGNPTRVIISNPPANEEIIYNIDSQNQDDKKLIEAISSLFVREAHALGAGTATPSPTPEATKTPVPLEFGATVEEVYKSVYKDDVTKGSEMFDKLNESIKTGEVAFVDRSGTNVVQGKGKISKEQLAKADAFKTTNSNFLVVTNIEVTNEKGQTFTVAFNPETNSWVRVTNLNAEAADYSEYTYIAGLQKAVENGDREIIILSQGTKDNHPYVDPFKGNPPNVLRWVNFFRGLKDKNLRYMYLDFFPNKVEKYPGWEEGRFVEGNLSSDKFAPTMRGRTTSGKEILVMTRFVPNTTGNIMEPYGVDKKAFDDFKNNNSGLNLVDYLQNKDGITGHTGTNSSYIVPVFPFPSDLGGWDPVSGLYGGNLTDYFLPDVGDLQVPGDFFNQLKSYPGAQDEIKKAVLDGDHIGMNSVLLKGGIKFELAKFLSRTIHFPNIIQPQY